VSKRKTPAKKVTRKRKPARRRKAHASFGQKLLVGFAGIVLTLCAASITYGFLVRSSGPGAHEFRIKVLNGTGANGLAHEARRGLLKIGVDVIDVGNADHFEYEESILYARKAGADVEELGRVIGCKNVVVQLKEGTLEDAALILGADYRELNLDLGSD